MNLEEIASMQFRDRITCFKCKKEIVSPNKKPVSICPHCGTSIMVALWMKEDDVKAFHNIIKASDMNRTGIAFIEAGKFDEGIKAFDDGLAIDPRHEDLWNNKGLALKGAERQDEAIKCFEKSISLNMNNGEPWHNMGAALVDLGRSAEAIKCCDKAFAINPQDAKAWFVKGLALSDPEPTKEAIDCFKKADALGFAPAKLALSYYQGNTLASGQAKKPWWKFW